MVALFLQLALLAQVQGQGQGNDTPQNPFGPLFLALPIILVLFYFMILRPQKQQQQTHNELLKNLKENDRVVTIGGIHGVVTNVQRDAERVTVRIDESTGTKIKVGLSAISRVITGDEADGGAGGINSAGNKS